MRIQHELRQALGGATARPDELELGGLDALGPAALDELDALELAAPAGQVAMPRGLEAALLGGSTEAAARALDLGRMTAALAAVVRRGPRPGETEREKRLRELCGRYLDLLQEAAAQMARISMG